jgi:hypothetical protein
MRRKSTGPKKEAGPYDILDDIDHEKLTKFAAIILTWNYIETFLDAMLGVALRIHPDLFPHVSSRINGIDGKTAIIKECVVVLEVDEEIGLPIRKTLNAVETYKRYRDGLVHMKIVDPKAEIADTIQRKGVSDEVLISQEALDALHERLAWLGSEMHQLFMLLHHAAIGDFAKKTNARTRALERARHAHARHLEIQQTREALPPLPKFPDELQQSSSPAVVQELRD